MIGTVNFIQLEVIAPLVQALNMSFQASVRNINTINIVKQGTLVCIQYVCAADQVKIIIMKVICLQASSVMSLLGFSLSYCGSYSILVLQNLPPASYTCLPVWIDRPR